MRITLTKDDIMRPRKDLLLAEVVLVVILFSIGVSAQDCYKVHSRDRYWRTSPGEYDETKMTGATCKAQCTKEGYKFASTQAGKFCFCSKTKPPDSDKVPPAQAKKLCSVKCVGAPTGTEYCGGPHYVTLTMGVAKLEDAWLTAKKVEIKETSTEVKLQFGVVGGGEKFVFNFDNTAGDTDVCFPTGFTNRDSDKNVKPMFHIPGVYNVIAEVTSTGVPGKTLPSRKGHHETTGSRIVCLFLFEVHSYSIASTPLQKLHAAVGVVAQSKPNDFEIKCPEQVEKSDDITKRDQEFACSATVYVGSNIKANIDFKDGKMYNIPMADPLITTAGPGIPQYGTCTGGAANKIYVMPGSDFVEDGVIIGWEFNLQSKGDITLMVLEPACKVGDVFCYDTYKCAKSCEISCSKSTQSFCSSRGMCTAKKPTTCPASPRSQTPSFDYKVKYTKSVKAATQKVGYNYIDERKVTVANLRVTRGMVLGYASASGKGVIATKKPWTGTSDYSKAYAAVAVGNSITQLSLKKEVNQQILLRAILSTPSTVKFFHHYTKLGVFDVGIGVTTTAFPAKAVVVPPKSTQITVLEGIKEAPLDVPPVNEAGKPLTLKVGKHAAKVTNVTNNNQYLWNFGDKSSVHMVNGTPITKHTFGIGKYNVCVEAKNAISGKTNCTTLEVKEKIGTIKVVNPTAVAGDNSTINITISKGSGYDCSIDYGDGSITHVNDTMLPKATGHVTHEYTTPGKYNVKVDCKNGLLPDPPVQAMPIEVQETITGLKFKTTGAQKGQPVKVQLGTNVKNGYGLKYKCTSVPPFKAGTSIDMSACDNKPKCDSAEIKGVVAQGYELTCTVANKLGKITDSTNFTIDSPINNPDFNVTDLCKEVPSPPDLLAYYIMVPSCVVFTGGMESGSSAFVKIDYGDSTPPDEKRMPPLKAWPTNYHEVFNHTYTKVGEFHAQGEIGNGDGSFLYNFTISAFKKSHLSCDNLGPQKPGAVGITFRSSDGSVPPDTTYTIDFGDRSTKGKGQFQLSTPISHNYNQPGTFSVKAVFTNLVEVIPLTCTVEVIEEILNPKFFLRPPNIAVGSKVSMLAQVAKGSGMKVTYSWGTTPLKNVTDGFNKSTTPALISEQKFDKPGNYTVSVTIHNKHGHTKTFTQTIFCQHPVTKDYNLVSDAPATVEFPFVNFTFTWTGTEKPTDASHVMHFGRSADGQESFDFDYKKKVYKWDKHAYAPPGPRTARVVVKNLVSEYTFTADASVQSKLGTLVIKTKYRPKKPLNGVDQPGVGESGNHFPSNRDLKFYPEFVGGRNETVSRYEIVAESDGYVWACTLTNIKPGDPLPYKIPGPGAYNICITAVKPLGEVTNCTSVVIGDTCHGISIHDGRATTKPNEPKEFRINFEKVGTNSCVAIDYGDRSKLKLYGTQNDCYSPEVLARLGNPLNSSIEMAGPLNPDGLNVSHIYKSEGPKRIKVIGANYLGVNEKSLQFSISASHVGCMRPEIMIYDERPFENGTHCEVGLRCKIRGKVILLNCTPETNIKWWEMERVDDNNNVTAMINLTEVRGHDGVDIELPAHFTNLGVYRLTLSVQMTGTWAIRKQHFISTAVTYIYMVRGPIFASMIEGGLSEITIGRMQNYSLTLNPERYSVDRDASPNDPPGFDGYLWFAQKIGEPDTDEDTKTTVSHQPSSGTKGGCFGNGPGRLDLPLNTGNFTPNFYLMPLNQTCNITAIVKKDTRSGRVSMLVTVVDGRPPVIIITCSDANACRKTPLGQRLVRPSGMCKLMVTCLTNCPLTSDFFNNRATYHWTIQYYNDTIDSLCYIDVKENKKYITGNKSKELTLLPPLFKDFSSDLYEAQARLTFNGMTGYAKMDFSVNRPPTSTKPCSVSPTTGTHITTKFIVSGDGWSDDRRIVAFEVYVKLENPDANETAPSQEFVQRFDAEGSAVKFELSTNLRPGTMDVIARVIDDEGAFTECQAGTVLVSPTSMSTSGLSDMLESTFRKGNPRDVAEVVVAGMNSQNDKLKKIGSLVDLENDDTSLTSAEDNLREEGTKFVENTLDNLEKSNVNLGAKSLTEIADKLVAEPATKNRNIMPKIANLLNKTVNTIDSDPDASNEDKLEMTGKVLAGLFNLKQGMKVTKARPGKSAREEAKKKAKPDMSLPRDGKSFDGDAAREERDSVAKTNKELSDEQEDDMYADLEEIEEKCLTMMVKKAPTGGKKVEVVSGKTKVVLQKDEAGKSRRLYAKHGDDEADVPSICEVDPPYCEDPHRTVSVAVVMSKNNHIGKKMHPHRTSSSVEIRMLDSDGNEKKINGTNVKVNYTMRMRLNETERKPVDYEGMEHGDPYLSISIRAEYPAIPDPPYCNYKSSELFIRPVPEPFDPNKAYMVFVAFDGRVNLTAGYYNSTYIVPSHLEGRDGTVGPESESDPYTFTLDAETKRTQMYAKDPCTLYIGLRELDSAEFETYNDSDTKPDVSQERVEDWRAKKGNLTSNVTVNTYAQNCMYYDEKAKDWSGRGCMVNEKKSTRSKVSCTCNHLTSFAGGWVVVPNRLDFNYIFKNMDPLKNPTVYATLITIILLYLIGAVICRKEDKKDVERACVYPLVDNDPDDKYMYELMVASGMAKGAGTHSRVYFVLSGENDETDVRILHDRSRGNKHCLDRGNIDCFLLTTPRPLGELNYARIWHDNSGEGKFASWYLKYFLVNDVQTKKKYQFILNRWLAVEEDDGQIDRLIPVAGKEQMVEFSHLFTQTSRKNLCDEHLWFSLVARPPRSRFTRLQRISCCLQLLVLTMLTNAMFYGIGDTEKPNTNALELGPFSLSPQQISIGVMANLIIFPATFLTVWLFRKARARKKRPSRIQEAKDRKPDGDSESNASTSVSDIRAEVNKCEPIRDDPPPYMRDMHDLNGMHNGVNGLQNGRTDSPPDSIERRIGIPMDDPLLKKKKKAFSLPWYCRHLAWLFLVIMCLVGITFSLFYGIQFGEEKSKKWITSMMAAFIMSIFITEPVKVFLVALFFSLILKKADDDVDDLEEDEEEPELQYDEEWLARPNDQGTFGLAKPRTIAYKPPDPEQLEKFRVNRLKELKMYAILREILSYALFVWILLSISYSFRDPDSYKLKEEMVNVFIENNKGDPDSAYTQIISYGGYWNWAKEVLLPALLVDPWYDQQTNYRQPYGQRGFIVDRAQRHMGYAVMRQLRAKPNSCPLERAMAEVINECVEEYGMFTQEEQTFGVGWKPYNETLDNTREEYKYTEASALDGFPYLGTIAVYAGGGYVHRLQGSDKEMMEGIDQLINEQWLDAYTRAIFIEFTVYNPNTNLFAVSTILTEFPGSTAMVNTYRFEPVNLLGDYHGDGKWYELTCQIGFCIFLVYFIYREIKVVFKERKAYFTHLWNIGELAIIGLSVASITIYFYRLVVTKSLLKTFKKSHGLAYVKFQYVASWNELLLYLVGWLVFFANLKFLRLLRFNKRMAILGSVLRHCRKDLFAFGVMFAIMFFAFVQFFYLIFLRNLLGYKSFVASAETSLNIMLGKFDFQAMLQSSSVLGPFFFFLYVVTIVMILINMFLSILNESFTIVKNDVSKQSNDYEMVDFIMRRFKLWTGIGNGQPMVSDLGADDPMTEKGDAMNMNGMPPAFQMQLDNFPDKIDKLLNTISKVYFDHDKIDALLDPSKMGNEGKAAMKMMLKQQRIKEEQETEIRERGFHSRGRPLPPTVPFRNMHVPMPDVENVEK
ncbi:uncharacterized protein LOC135489174 [Lineus longissimus]|uniref:uncharacterized protein LOC135489174 n=1 Tax=Lineus longissimus TaxID=88925 RepID=UPI00315DBDFE